MIKKELIASSISLFISLGATWPNATSAAPLSPNDCNSWPFVRPSTGVTPRELRRELKELESVGYQPSDNDVHYPSDIQAAEARLRIKYRHDCTGKASQLPANRSPS
ncbi:DUF4148 domain-containing protein [Paraburkholderia bannensis]|uniref:DUF4148 domain-containing protein n=1 Tax=Paraburkholderia bannensis TaxID=765414 RepID=UPI001427C248